MNTTYNIRERHVLWSFGLSILTFGIYSLWWTYKLHNETNEITDHRMEPSGGLVVFLGIITCGIYLVYWSYRQGIKFRSEAVRRGSEEARDCPWLYLVMQCVSYFIGITWPINLALMQDRLNQLLRMRGLGNQPYDPQRFNHTPEADIAARARARAEEYEASLVEDELLADGLSGKRALFLSSGDGESDGVDGVTGVDGAAGTDEVAGERDGNASSHGAPGPTSDSSRI